MPLIFNLRQLERKNLHLDGELSPNELEADGFDELIAVHSPIRYDLWIERLGGDILVQGWLQATLECECVRCLKHFQASVRLERWSVDLPLTGEEKIPVDNDSVDLTPLIREDILLAFPQHPLCKRDCSGLPKQSQKPAKHGGGANLSGGMASPWAELNKLKF